MSDELRDRIAATLDRNFNPDQYPIMSVMFRDYAQAVIDDLGLHAYEFTPSNGPTRTYVHGAIKENDQ